MSVLARLRLSGSLFVVFLVASGSAVAAYGCSDPPAAAALDASVVEEAPDAALPPPPPVELGRHTVIVESTRQVVPGAGFPSEVVTGQSNNNLDIVRFDGRLYFAFRTSKDHFASSETGLYVVSTTDEVTWRYEAKFASDGDLREPRFLVLGKELLLYMARLGTDPLKFEPKGTSVAKRREDGSWAEPVDIGKPGYIAWRTRVERGTPYMAAYLGGEYIYDFSGKPLAIELLTTKDGLSWTAPEGQDAVVSRGGGSETDFTLADDGTLYAVIRNEAGDETGFGSKICKALPGKLGQWSCKNDPRKYDSPLMFRVDDEVYLIGRRNVTETGAYDLQKRENTIPAQEIAYQLDYRGKPKRCSLWRYVKEADRIAYVLDLPSRGDTCFAGVVEGNSPGERIVYDYSSPLDSPEDLPWGKGQIGPTHIYRHVLRFEAR